MLTADLTQTLSPDFIVHDDVLRLCGCPKVAVVLAKFIWWSQVTERKYPERCGWFHQTWRDFLQQFNLKRRGYEKARQVLVDQLGVLEYRRGGVFGKMHWRINVEKLQAALCELKGKKPSLIKSNFARDRDGFLVPISIPIDRWHDYLDSRTRDNGRLVQDVKIKKRWVRQLETAIKECDDIGVLMAYATAKGWKNFYMHESVNWQEAKQIAKMPRPILRPKEDKPHISPSPPPDVNSLRSNIKQTLKIKS